jgi:hypothetical protein
MASESRNRATRDHTLQHDALEHHAAGARLAFACPFSSSDEFYADIIGERRAAGAYGTRWYRGYAAMACAGIVLLAGILFAL